MRKGSFVSIFTLVVMSVTPFATVHAQGSALGTDAWTAQLISEGLFTPHINTCDSSEVFIAMGGTSDKGFCIEKNQRSALEFEDARELCMSLRKRLPEPAEFKFACQLAPTGLNDMTGDYEWASNFGTINVGDNGNGQNAYLSWAAGLSGCAFGGGAPIADVHSTTTAASLAYRCVR